MEKNNSKKSENILTILSIIIILGILSYIVYLFIHSNSILNSNSINNTLSNNTSNYTNSIKNDVKAEKEIIYEEVEIANFTTTLYDSSADRTSNIIKACEILNDTLVKAGEEFSFNNTIGPMGLENGYKLAKGFDSNGKVIDIPGAGMCQVSSTLYNVALLSNLEITERHPHSRRVYYVPADKDATVYYNTLDLKFINNRENDIKIYASVQDYDLNIKICEIKQSN